MSFFILASLVAGATFLALLVLQWLSPLRRQSFPPLPHAIHNGLFALPALVLMRWLLIPIPLAAAQWATQKHLGLLHLLSLPSFVAPLVGFLLLDYSYYWWHVATHRVPFLWRFHAVHHVDLDMDVSTAARFHWGEILISVVLRVALVTLLGVAPLTFLIYEIVFECATQFHHSNWRLNENVERGVNRILVTPRMHGTHHSVRREWLDSNWGTVFSWWDKLHGTHRIDAPDDLKIGLLQHRDPRELTILELWKMPFQKSRDAS